MIPIFERFTDRARRVLVWAQEESRLLGHNFIGVEHILVGILDENEGVGALALKAFDLSPEMMRSKIEEFSPAANGGGSTGSPPFTPEAKKMLEYSLREALQLGHSYIGTEHLLLAVIRSDDSMAVQVLTTCGADLGLLRKKVIELLAIYSGSHEATVPEPPDAAAVLERVIGVVGKRVDELAARGMRDRWLDDALHFYEEAFGKKA